MTFGSSITCARKVPQVLWTRVVASTGWTYWRWWQVEKSKCSIPWLYRLVHNRSGGRITIKALFIAIPVFRDIIPLLLVFEYVRLT